VYKQPESPEELELCNEALEGCPVEAIGDDDE
jgi:ferredoxin